MTPTSSTTKKDIETFHYPYSKLKAWLKDGYENGNVGFLLVQRNFNLKYYLYKGFGTIENPSKFLKTMIIKHFELFDGPWATTEQILNPKPLFNKEDIKHVFIDMSEYNDLTTKNYDK